MNPPLGIARNRLRCRRDCADPLEELLRQASACCLRGYARDSLGRENLGILAATLNPDSVSLLSSADCYLSLSVWQHLVRQHGVEQTSAFTRDVWERTGRVLFFESGEVEIPGSWGLPDLGPNAREWFDRYLTDTCEGGRVQHLGEHRAFTPDGQNCVRKLFAVLRMGE